ncbi:sulfite reductase flavoprotein subunit alpha [Paraburkholderia sp. J67]|uniref:sulfite reductase flavoprotein subunit alpha n=1 Tax=Paraburkholderia sp. J67 TaxID=2805435 RepID=UPI002ABD50B1|nr:sulfite reductase flavoprotein subunit alpha [Paraburkholderia sp. J67]
MKRARFMGIVPMAWALACAGAVVAWWTPLRLASAAAVLFAYVCACVGIVVAHRRRETNAPLADTAPADTILIAYASQTGSAELIATQTRTRLEASGARVQLVALGALEAHDLAAYTRALFVVSTTGEGDAPDAATAFVRNLMSAQTGVDLGALRYGVLALGDRQYANYCAFGYRLTAWLAQHAAQPLFETIDVDNGEMAALERWQTQLAALCDGVTATPWPAVRDSVWTLDTRTLLNPGSAGEPVYHLALQPSDSAALEWLPGDIAEILPRHASDTVQRWLDARALDGVAAVQCDGAPMTLANVLATRQLALGELDDLAALRSPQEWADTLPPLAHRSYSIASLPGDGQLELLVRQARHADDSAAQGFRLGVASGWLTEHAARGSEIRLRVRTNRTFHPPADDRPLILIGNGTGLAGLRAHLKRRVRAGHGRIWLIFGERNAAHDAFYRDELSDWHERGLIERLDPVWSRDGSERRYVQDALAANAEPLREWIDAGASIYVCGSRNGMAPGVHRALVDALGQTRVDTLLVDGRYRRDVY